MGTSPERNEMRLLDAFMTWTFRFPNSVGFTLYISLPLLLLTCIGLMLAYVPVLTLALLALWVAGCWAYAVGVYLGERK